MRPQEPEQSDTGLRERQGPPEQAPDSHNVVSLKKGRLREGYEA
ncbi:hypothetical protein F0726_01668 [Acidithiobacillus caldus]|nr:hypothetical protein F0726_01668 [Acidithiobacillus caldus]